MSDAPLDARVETTPAAGKPRSPRGAGLFRNIFSNWVWYGLVVVSGFLVPRFISDLQGKELLGVWDWSWSLIVYVSLMAIGITAAVNRYVARYRSTEDWDALNTSVNTCLVLLSFSALAGIGLAIFFSLHVDWLLASPDGSGGRTEWDPELLHIASWVVFLLSLSSALQLPGGVFNGGNPAGKAFAIRKRHHQMSARFEYTGNIPKRCSRLGQILQYPEARDQIKGTCAKRQLLGVGYEEMIERMPGRCDSNHFFYVIRAGYP